MPDSDLANPCVISTGSFFFLQFQNSLLSQVDQELPFARHRIGFIQQFDMVEDTVAVMFVGPQKVIIGDPQGDVIVGPVIVVVTAGNAVGSFKGPVQAFDQLFIRPEFCGDRIIIGKADDLGHFEVQWVIFSKTELLGGQGVGAVTVGNEAKVLWEFLYMAESHPHSKDAGTDAAVIRDLIADDGPGYRVHDEPYIPFDTADFDIGFICGENIMGFISIVVGKGFDDKGCRAGIVGDLLVGDPDAVKILKSLGRLAKRETEVYVHGQAEPHDMGIELFELQGRSILWKGIQIHGKEIPQELPIDVVELITGFSMFFRLVFLIHFFEVFAVIRTILVQTFVDPEELPVLDSSQGMTAVRAGKL